ncbi:MAG: hypothetical protein IPK84_04620 [Candidatus Moraniibacteriota bacterium]|nr:MAG: hypothetical protein IPK84_04620 [Candidatus Moranbacteria bacterium]
MSIKKMAPVLLVTLPVGIFVVAWMLAAHSILFRPFDSIPPGSLSASPSPAAVSHTETEKQNVAAPDDVPVKSTTPEPKIFSEFTENDIRKGYVRWQDPVDMGDLGWTNHEVYSGTYEGDDGYSGGVRYVKVGTIIKGKYSGSDIIVVASWIFSSDYPRNNAPEIAHYLRGANGVIRLPNADVANGEIGKNPPTSPAATKAEDESGKTIMDIKAPNEQVDFETRIEDLAGYGLEFQGENDREVFVRDTYSPKAFFSEHNLKSVFTHSDLGKVWMTVAPVKNDDRTELNSYIERSTIYDSETNTYKQDAHGKYIRVEKKKYYSPVVVGGFYVKRPDGIMETYRLKFDIFDKFDRDGVLEATWSDGSRNETSYEEYPSGCGTGSYAYDETGSVSIKNDLTVVGKTDKGDILYGYRDSHPYLKKYFNDTYLPSLEMRRKWQGASSGAATTTADTDTVSEWGTFLSKRPIVFWVDPVGRLLAFYNTETMELAECGKPVVYLYPKNTLDVSVRVFPNEGVSVSKPPYEDGWNVQARPDGTLLNYVDGKTYPYLFWEGGSNVLYQAPEKGFVTSRENLSAFFDEKLSQAGLSAKEAADFKEFWIPRMEALENPYYFVTFLAQEEIDRIAPLVVAPTPDTIIRVMMDFRGMDRWENVPGLLLHAPERKGFTAVEWGGRLGKK